MPRCVNIDWLELYCRESDEYFPCNADFFRQQGFNVRERDYGTRQYNQMFVILDKDLLPFLEIRRDPVSSKSGYDNKGMFDAASCHIRMSNRYCYADNVIQLITDFLQRFNYEVCRLYRLDLCLDFELFDRGDNPQDVLKRYMKGKYTKINQGNVSAHGRDQWEQRNWNSLSWGAPTSMVSTKFYNKTIELQEAKDKPYIRYAWWRAGLVNDWVNLTKIDKNGNIYHPTIWRVEFSIRSSARGWYTVEDCNGNKEKILHKEHTLATYADKESQLKAFAALAYHYFHFKIYKEGVRKDRCEDKVLFDFSDHSIYHLDRLLTDKTKDTTLEALKRRLEHFRLMNPSPEVRKACDIILQAIEKLRVRDALPNYGTDSEAFILQQLIARTIKGEEFNLAKSHVKAILELKNVLF